jgi:hypothetical protein
MNGNAIVATLGLLAMAACAPDTPVDPMPPSIDEPACGAEGLQDLVGRSRQVLQTMKFARETRIIGPDTAVTMDYRTDRLNIEYDKAGVITRVACY